eukprot:TRINITY_DN16_c1_g1_i3.p3 TRINITY_DN16_c1_g1~~TRINITY_DN16_c1_g1_i3.p3  ORF type:complete len:202 (+),score=34.06 TRINITY_DN16_c1_g1_i3:323-928(+)
MCQAKFVITILLSIITLVSGINVDILSAFGGDGSLFLGDRGIVYGDSDDASAAGLVSAFLAGDSDSIFGANVGGINIDRGNSNAFVAGVNGLLGEADDGVVGYGILAQLAALTDSEGLVASQSLTGVSGQGEGDVDAASVQGGSVETSSGSAGFFTAGQAIAQGNDPQASIASGGLATQTQDTSISAAIICASAGGALPCK